MKGRCKEDFEKWAIDNLETGTLNHTDIFGHANALEWDKLPESMKWGVIQDFFDSVGIDITVFDNYFMDWEKGFQWVVETNEDYKTDTLVTRQEARNAAIEKACELYNEKA